MNSKLTAIAVCTAVTVIGGGGYAVAATVVTGKTIKNGSITTKDVKKGTIKLDRLSKGTQALIRKAGTPGRNGANGGNGANGAPGAPGAPGGGGTDGADAGAGLSQNWGTIFRNTIGSPDIDLAGGPNSAVPFGGEGVSSPPFGVGSLTMQVAGNSDAGDTTTPTSGDDREAASFGNEVGFTGDSVSGLDELGFQVFTTGENAAKDPANLPNISIEVDPNLEPASATGFSTLVFEPAARPASERGRWSAYIDATDPADGRFRLTGAAGTASGCNQTTPCEFDAVKTILDDATVFSVAVTKGRDFAFQGAVDGLQVNGDVFDFEAGGTRTTVPAP